MRAKPRWLKVGLPSSQEFFEVKRLLRNNKLHTVCEEANCPNIAECFGRRTATFMILGRVCTRNCRYCNVQHGIPDEVNYEEPLLIARAAKRLKLSYVVITSVTRDDLSDYGAEHFARVVRSVKSETNAMVELLVPDFNGSESSIRTVLEAGPDVLNHNIEVVQRLFKRLRPEGSYDTSLKLLKLSKSISSIPTKSGFMIGLGETKQDIIKTMGDLRRADVDMLTIGQYLQPSLQHEAVRKYYTPEEFQELYDLAVGMGFSAVASGPLVRSSYHAHKMAMKVV